MDDKASAGTLKPGMVEEYGRVQVRQILLAGLLSLLLLAAAMMLVPNYTLAWVRSELPWLSHLISRVEIPEIRADRTPSIIKIDVEGYEHAVIAGGQFTLASPSLQVVIMETNGSGLRYGWDDAELVDTMRGYGFTTCSYSPILRRLEPAAPSETGNTLFVRDVAAMQERVAQAASFRLVDGRSELAGVVGAAGLVVREVGWF